MFSGCGRKADLLAKALDGANLIFDQASSLLPRQFHEHFGVIVRHKTNGHHIGAALAGWSELQQAWSFARVDTFGHDGCPANTLNMRDLGLMRPAPDLEGGGSVDEAGIQENLRAFGLAGFASRVLNAQRHVQTMDLGAGAQACSFGGEGELFWIDRNVNVQQAAAADAHYMAPADRHMKNTERLLAR